MAPAMDVAVISAPTAPASPETTAQPSVLESITILANDPIPNIRFNVAKAFEVLSTILATQSGGTEIIKDSIIPGLLKLKEDQDADVRYFAGKALEVGDVSGFLPVASIFTQPAHQVAGPIAEGQPVPPRTSGDLEMTDA